MTRNTSSKEKEKEHEGSVEDEGPACQSCRKKKAKCSREQPCSHCARMNVECQYDESRSRPGVKAGVIESLSQRLDTLEKMFLGQTLVTRQLLSAIREVNPALAPNKVTADLDEYVKINSLNNKRPSSSLTSEVEDLKRELLQMSSSTQIETPVNSKRRKLAEIALKNSHDENLEHRTPCNIRPPKTIVVEVPDVDDSCLPPVDLIDILVHLYFEIIHPWIPVLHKGSFLKRLQQPAERAALTSVLHAIVASTVRFSDDPRLERKEARDKYFRICRQTVILQSMDTFSVENLQALVIIAFDTIGSGRGPKSWAIVGSMTRTVEHLRLSFEDDMEDDGESHSAHRLIHRISFLGPSKNWTEAEERRRVFWNVFLLDRFCSVATGWNTSLTSADVRRRLPCEGAIWEAEQPVRTRYFGISDHSSSSIRKSTGELPLPSSTSPDDQFSDEVISLGGFAYCIEATESLSQVTRFFLQQAVNLRNPEDVQQWLMRFKELDLRLVRWKLFLPPQWREATVRNGHMDPNLTLAHITHNTSVILLHQGIAYPSLQWQTSSIKLPSSSSADTCLSAAIEITTITQQYLIHNAGITNPQFSFCLFVSGRVLLAHASFYNTVLRPEFFHLVKALFDISKRWRGMYTDQGDAYNLPAGFAQRLLQAQAQSDPNHQGVVDIRKPAYSDHFDSDEISLQAVLLSEAAAAAAAWENVAVEPLSLASPPMPLSFQTQGYNNNAATTQYPMIDQTAPQRIPPNQRMGQAEAINEAVFTVEQLAEFSNLFADPQFLEFDRVLTYSGDNSYQAISGDYQRRN